MVNKPEINYRAALIGCGNIGCTIADDPKVNGIYAHAHAYTICKSTKLVGICDIDSDKLDHCAQKWGIENKYTNYNELLNREHPEIVSVCTPDNTHYEIIKATLLTSGLRAIVAEKPLALNLNEAEELVHLAGENNILLYVNYIRRYAESHIRLRDFIKSGGIGNIQTIGGYYTKGLLNNGTHWFDLARFIIGEVKAVWARDTLNEKVNDPTLDVFLDFECGTRGYLVACDHNNFSIFEMDLIGTKGRVKIVSSGNQFEIYTVKESPYCTGYKLLEKIDGTFGEYREEGLRLVQDVVHCLNTGDKPLCSGEDAFEALKIGVAATNAAKNNIFVQIKDI